MANTLKSGKPFKALSISETARILGVHRHTLRYWLKKKWVQPPRKDYRGYPVFAPEDIEAIKKWRRTLK
jgi:DNA-binding transcriptional MerR regulator